MKIFMLRCNRKTNVILLTLILLFISQGIFAQTTGDYRSAVNNTNWSTLSSWERYNGTSWTTPTLAQGYPGQNSGTNNVVIRFGGSIYLDISPVNVISSLNIGDGTTADSGLSNNPATLSIGTSTLLISGDVIISNANLSRNGVLNNGSGTVKIGGILSTAGNGTYTSSTGTIEYNGNGAQSIFATTYYNLITSGNGIKTMQSATIVNGNMTIDLGTTLDEAGVSTTLGNTSVLTINGTLDFSSSFGLIRTGNNQNATLIIGPSGVIKTADNNGLGPAANASLQNQGTGTWTTNSINTNGTVEYYRNASSGQIVTDRDYNNLTITGTSQTKTWTIGTARTIGGTITIAGNLTLSGNQIINIGGNLINNSGTFVAGTGTINMTGTTQNIGGINNTTFNNLLLSTNGTKTFSKTTTVNNLNIASGVTVDLSTLTHSAGTLTLGGFGTPSGSWGSISSSATNKSNTYFTTTTGIINITTGTCSAISAGISGTATICNGGSSNFTVTITGGASPYTVFYTGGNGGILNDYTNGTNVSVNPTSNTTYILNSVLDSNKCSATTSGSSVITVRSTFTSGSINAIGETICYNGNPNIIESSTIASGGDESITYKWQANGNDIANSNSVTYDPPAGLTISTTYTRWAKDNTCNTTFTQSTGSWVVTVTQPIQPSNVNCWDDFQFDTTTCAWVNNGSQPNQPSNVNCWDDFQFDTTMCAWVNNGSQPEPPTVSAQSFFTPATVADLTATGIDIKWYSSETGGTALASDITINTGTYYASQTLLGCESSRTAVSVSVTPTTVTYCKGAVATPLTAVLTTGTSLKWYTVATGGTALTTAPTLVTTTVGTKYYWVSQDNGVNRVKITVTINALPATPGTITGTAAQGALVGTMTPATYSIAPVVGAVSYVWTAPSGVNIVSGGDTTAVTVNFNDVAAGAGSIGSLSVKAVNANGCNSAAKTLSLTKALPTAPASLTMTDGVTTTAITNFGKYIGQPTVLTLKAAPVTTATSYEWELPAGVNQLSGNTSNIITANFADVANGTTLLRIGVKAKNGTGASVTNNAALVPATASTAKLLTLSASIPAAPTSVKLTNGVTTTAITDISKYIGTDQAFTLTAAAVTTASSYEWDLPTGVNQLSGDNSNVITVDFAGVPAGTTYLYLGARAKNGVGVSVTNNAALTPATSSTYKLLKVTSSVPAAPASVKLTNGVTTTAITNISKYIGTEQVLTLTAAAVTTATSYEWELPAGVNLLSGDTSNIITIDFSGVPAGTTSLYLGVRAKNGVGVSLTNNATLTPATSSTYKLLKVTSSVPAAVSAVTGQIVGVCGNNSYTYTITASSLANSYVITAPAGSVVTSASNSSNTTNVLSTSDLTFSVLYPSDLATITPKTVAIASVNGVGTSLTSKTLTISIAMPAIGAATGSNGITSFQRCATQTFTVPAVLGATEYVWVPANGAVIVNGQGTNSVEVDFSYVPESVTKTILKVSAKNSCDVSSTAKSITLNSTTCVVGRMTNTSNETLVVYPNPVVDMVTITNANVISAIEVFNLLGQHVLSARPNAMTTTMDMGNLPMGTYVLEIQSEGKISIVKVVKN